MPKAETDERLIIMLGNFRRERHERFCRAMRGGRSFRLALAIFSIVFALSMPCTYCSITLSVFIATTICVIVHPFIVRKYIMPRYGFSSSYQLIRARYSWMEGLLDTCMDRNGNLKCAPEDFKKQLAAMGVNSFDDLPSCQPAVCRVYGKDGANAAK